MKNKRNFASLLSLKSHLLYYYHGPPADLIVAGLSGVRSLVAQAKPISLRRQGNEANDDVCLVQPTPNTKAFIYID